VDGENFDANTVTFDLTIGLETLEVRHNVFSETILSGGEHDLTTSKLEAGSVEGLFCDFDVLGLNSDRDEDLVDSDTGSLDVGFAESLTHALLESIGTSA
jgi:hypothetical protein